MKQLTIDFTNKYSGYSSVREFIQLCAIPGLIEAGKSGKGEYVEIKQIAADMDESPSTFAKKLSGNERNVWSSDDTEKFMQITKCIEPAKYLTWIYLRKSEDEKDKEITALREKLEELTTKKRPR